MSDNLQESQSPNFDVSTAIQVCRQANYHRHALALAKKYGYHNWSVMTSDLARDIIVCFSTVCGRYLLIQLEDMHNCVDAMEYISQLKFRDVSTLPPSLPPSLTPSLPHSLFAIG